MHWLRHEHWLRREGILLAIFGGFGLLALPGLVYLVGQRLLGEYRPDATIGTFYADLYGYLLAFSAWAWLLVLGPWLAVQFLRLLWLPLGTLSRPRPSSRDEELGDDPADAGI